MQYIRIKKGLSRFDLAAALNRRYDTIKQWEHGILPIPVLMLAEIRRVLEVYDPCWQPMAMIEISDEEYMRFRKFFRMGGVEYTNPSMIYFLGKHFPVRSLADVAEGIRERKRLRELAKEEQV